MPTDECVIENCEQSKKNRPDKISFEREIENAKKWLAKENLEFTEKYPNQIPQPEQTEHYEIIRSLFRCVNVLTARAEQAERERDAAVAVIGIQAKQLKESHVVLCNICKFEDMIGCVHKNHCDGYQLFKWRGLPQDGEGV